MENKKKIAEETKNEEKKTLTNEELLELYNAQSENDDDIHFEHYDWTYNDSSCCC